MILGCAGCVNKRLAGGPNFWTRRNTRAGRLLFPAPAADPRPPEAKAGAAFVDHFAVWSHAAPHKAESGAANVFSPNGIA